MPDEIEKTIEAAVTRAVAATEKYTAEDLEHLSDLQHVRERFGMYIGDNTARGLHHLVYEVVDNSVDEAMAGFAHNVRVTINNDGSVTVTVDRINHVPVADAGAAQTVRPSATVLLNGIRAAT